MRIFRDWTGLPDDARHAAAAIGNFDGVHLGHKAVIDRTRDEARRIGGALAVVTFEPHPRTHFAPDAPPFRLTNAETRAHRLEKIGVETLFELPFDARLCSLSPKAFAREVIAEGLGLSHVVIGADFRFGRGRAGDAPTLAALGRDLGFGVTALDLVGTGEIEISSTRIREALADGRPDIAADLLGHLHRIDGPVIHGEKRGRKLGYPTANLALDGLHLPKFGVYAVDVHVFDGPQAGRYGGVASLGRRPMFGDNVPNLETYLFDFSGDLYDRHISVGLVRFLRPEATFDSLDSFIAQMDRDSAEARAALA